MTNEMLEKIKAGKLDEVQAMVDAIPHPETRSQAQYALNMVLKGLEEERLKTEKDLNDAKKIRRAFRTVKKRKNKVILVFANHFDDIEGPVGFAIYENDALRHPDISLKDGIQYLLGDRAKSQEIDEKTFPISTDPPLTIEECTEAFYSLVKLMSNLYNIPETNWNVIALFDYFQYLLAKRVFRIKDLQTILEAIQLLSERHIIVMPDPRNKYLGYIPISQMTSDQGSEELTAFSAYLYEFIENSIVIELEPGLDIYKSRIKDQNKGKSFFISHLKKNDVEYRQIATKDDKSFTATKGIISTDLTPLSNCPKITHLAITETSLSNIDLSPFSEFKKLDDIYLRKNKLKSIDLSPLSNSKKIRILSISDNRLKEISLAPLVNFSVLQRLELQNNKLSEIDLTPISLCKELEELNLSNNQLTTINLEPLSKCRKLVKLYLEGNKLSIIDFEPLKACKKLEYIILNKNQLKEIDITPLGECDKLFKLEVDESTKIYWRKRMPLTDELPYGLDKHFARIHVKK
ncbi:MAG: leucine-rich repeat domain-containing protein [Asgard group archaeon]|nr:leucine-rich repeat domain-containing protein [Asgard group archaeon]